jgi:hypothetical protein
MRKLNGMYKEYLGSLEFKCDYFTPDLDKIREKQQSECCCDEQKCEQKGEQKRIKININQIKI